MDDFRNLIWEDDKNLAHMRDKHGVSRQEVEEVCYGTPIILQTYAGRILAIGLTGEGRMLTVVLEAKREGDYYPVTARAASRSERRIYRAEGANEP